MVDHIYMAFPVPLQTLWIPWTIFVPLMFPISSLKTLIIWCTRLSNPFSRIYPDTTPKPTYIGMCTKGQMFLEFSLMWIWITCLLAFHMPQDRSDLTFHYPIEALYKEPFAYIEGEELKSKKTIVHCWQSLYLSLHPFIAWITFVLFPSFPFACELSTKRGTKFLWFGDVPIEVVTIVISVLY